jgi:hypothetical protein
MVALADLALGHSLPAQVGLVHLDDAAQQATFVFHHSANALAEKPCGLLADAKMLGQLDRRDAFAAGGYQIKRREPRPHRQVRAFDCRPHRRREHVAASAALPVMRTPFEFGCCPDTAAFKADWAFGPANGLKVTPASVVIREPGKEREQRHAGTLSALHTKVNRSEFAYGEMGLKLVLAIYFAACNFKLQPSWSYSSFSTYGGPLNHFSLCACS